MVFITFKDSCSFDGHRKEGAHKCESDGACEQSNTQASYSIAVELKKIDGIFNDYQKVNEVEPEIDFVF